MLSLSLDVVQPDCPYIATSREYDVTLFTKQWDFDEATDKLEARIMVKAADSTELDRAVDWMRDHKNMYDAELLRRKGEKALLRAQIGETKAMSAIRKNDGYITGPFEIKDGSETWRVGFDNRVKVDRALSDLEQHNEFSVQSKESVDLEEYFDVMHHVDVAGSLLKEFRELSEVERQTLTTAVDEGYFSRPRDATLTTLADEFDISKTAVSKNLRRSQRKILDQVVDAIETVNDGDQSEVITR